MHAASSHPLWAMSGILSGVPQRPNMETWLPSGVRQVAGDRFLGKGGHIGRKISSIPCITNDGRVIYRNYRQKRPTEVAAIPAATI